MNIADSFWPAAIKHLEIALGTPVTLVDSNRNQLLPIASNGHPQCLPTGENGHWVEKHDAEDESFIIVRPGVFANCNRLFFSLNRKSQSRDGPTIPINVGTPGASVVTSENGCLLESGQCAGSADQGGSCQISHLESSFLAGCLPWLASKTGLLGTNEVVTTLLETACEISGGTAAYWLTLSSISTGAPGQVPKPRFDINGSYGHSPVEFEQARLNVDAALNVELVKCLTDGRPALHSVPVGPNQKLGPPTANAVACIPIENNRKKLGVVLIFGIVGAQTADLSLKFGRSPCAAHQASHGAPLNLVMLVCSQFGPVVAVAERKKAIGGLLESLLGEIKKLIGNQATQPTYAVYSSIANYAKAITRAGACSIWLPSEQKYSIELVGAADGSLLSDFARKPKVYDRINDPDHTGVTGSVAHERKLVKLSNIDDHPYHRAGFQGKGRTSHSDFPPESTKAFLAVPFPCGECETWGVLRMESDCADTLLRTGTFDTQDVDAAKIVANILSVCYLLVQETDEIRRLSQYSSANKKLEAQQRIAEFAAQLRLEATGKAADQDLQDPKTTQNIQDRACRLIRQLLFPVPVVAYYEKKLDEQNGPAKLIKRAVALAENAADGLPTELDSSGQLMGHVIGSGMTENSVSADRNHLLVSPHSVLGIASPVMSIRKSTAIGVLIAEGTRSNQFQSIPHATDVMASVAVHLAAALDDLAEKKAALAQSKLLKAISALAAQIAHDARNEVRTAIDLPSSPLASVKPGGNLLGVYDHLNNELDGLINLMSTTTKQNFFDDVRSTVDEVFQRIEKSKDPHRSVDTIFMTLINDKIELQVVPSGNLPPVLAPTDLVWHLLRIFMVNSLQALKPIGKGVVTVSARQVEKDIIITVNDNGPGMDRKLMKDFSLGMAPSSKTNQKKAFGCALARAVVDIFNWNYEVNPGADGVGTCVEITLPTA